MSERPPLEKAKETAYRFLTLRPRSVAEVRTRLREKGFDEETVAAAVERLKELRLLDDDDLARRMARDLANLRGLGRYQVEMRILTKGVERAVARRAVDAVFSEIDEVGAARRALGKKLGDHPADTKEKGRLGRYLHGRGYSWEIITEVLRELDERERDQE